MKLCLLLGILLSHSAVADTIPQDLLGHFAEWKKDPWTVARFKKELAEHRVQSVREALALLPPWLRSSYTLVHSSGDLSEQADASHPRVIFFSPDGKFHLSFAEKNGGSIKAAQFQDDRLELTDFRFSEKEGLRTENCTGCHGKDPSFIVDSYPHWHGWYGAQDDSLRSSFVSAFQQFKEQSASHPLYGLLLSDPRFPFYPYHRWEPAGKNSSGRGFASMPNTRLSTVVNRLQGRIAYRRVKESAAFKKYRFLLAHELLEDSDGKSCDPIDHQGKVVDLEGIVKALGVENTGVRTAPLAQPCLANEKKEWEFFDGFYRTKHFVQELLWRDLEKSNLFRGVRRSVGVRAALKKARREFAREARYHRANHLTEEQIAVFDSLGLAMVYPEGGLKGFQRACKTTRRLALKELEDHGSRHVRR